MQRVTMTKEGTVNEGHIEVPDLYGTDEKGEETFLRIEMDGPDVVFHFGQPRLAIERDYSSGIVWDGPSMRARGWAIADWAKDLESYMNRYYPND
jgi:hypothetical protein